jgi:DNA-binding CsgD family transcriptional regulator
MLMPNWWEGAGRVATLEQFSSLVADIYDAALDPTRWDQALRHVCSVTGGNNSSLVLYDQGKRRRPHIIAANFDPLQIRKYDEYFCQIDPLAPILERSLPGVIVTARSATQESQRCGEFYNDWAHPNQTGDTVFVNVTAGDEGVCTFMIGHAWGLEPFPTPEVLRVAGLLASHLQRALHAQLDFGDLSLVRAGALDLIDRWRHGCILISSTGAVLYANRAANQIAASGDGLTLAARGLKTEIPRENATLQCLIHEARANNGQAPRSGSRLAISRNSRRQPYTVQVLPVRMSRVYVGDTAAAALVLIIDHGREAHLEPADLRNIYDLTQAEARVALLVSNGHGLQFAADKLRVGLSTVRVHLQRVFEKTQTHRQAELTKLLVELEATFTLGK